MAQRTNSVTVSLALTLLLLGMAGCSTPLTTREKGALIGTGVGAAAGAAVGSAVGHTGAGAAIGGGLGLATGALIGDRMQAAEQAEQQQQRQIEQQRAEIERNREQLAKTRHEEPAYASRGRNDRPPYFLPEERAIIREYYYASRSRGLPPGLAKRGGNLPPGLQKQLQRNGKLPPGLQKRLEPIPVDLERQLPAIPEIWVRVILGGNILLLDRRSNLILDLIENVAG